MSWFVLALLGPFLFAVTNYIDKALLQNYFKEGGVGTLLIVSAVLAGAALPIFFIIDPTPFSMSPMAMATMASVSVLHVLVLFFYLKALDGEEVSTTIIFYQLVPVFAFVMGFFVLGETLVIRQLIAMAVIIIGTSLVSFDLDGAGIRMRLKTAAWMTAASLCWALASVIFKAVALEENVIRTLFWEHLVLMLIGIGLFVLVEPYRHAFLKAMRLNSRPVLSLNLANEGIYMLGNAVVAFALMMAPVALILLGNSFQAIFSLLIGIAVTLLWPKLAAERLQLGHLARKAAAIAITGCGVWLLTVGPAPAQSIEAELSTSYLDADTFMDRFSDRPLLRLTGAVDVGENGYLEVYGATGFEKPFRDRSSEFGIEFGGEWETGRETSLNIAGGRWMNYAGAGTDAGDWFGRMGLSHRALHASASLLIGDSDTIVLNAAYEFSLSERIIITPSLGYLTATDALNVGLVGEFHVSDRVHFSVVAVAPETGDGGREAYVAGAMIWRWDAD